MQNAATYKALKYLNTKTGDQYPAYEVQVPVADRFDKVDKIIVETFDEDSGIRYQKMINWQEFAKYEMVSWPKIGTVVGVTFANGTIKRAKAYTVNFRDCPNKFNASKLNRATQKIVGDCGDIFYEVPALTQFANSKKTDEDVRRCFACPWERDNAKEKEA